MARNTIKYNQIDNAVITDGQQMVDFMDGESIVFEITGNSISATHGTDGVKLSTSSPRPGILTLNFKPTSPSIDFLQEHAVAAVHGDGDLFNSSVTTGVRDVLRMKNCLVEDAGFSTGSGTMQARQFKIYCEAYELLG